MTLKLREDIYPNLQDTELWKREEHLKTIIKTVLEAFSDKFKTEEEVISFVNKIKTPSDAELFLDISGYFNIAKNYLDIDYIKLIMFFSVIETVKIKDFKPVHNWVSDTHNIELSTSLNESLTKYEHISLIELKQILEGVFQLYEQKFGVRKAVFEFFNKFLSQDDKIWLVKSFKTKKLKFVARFSEKLPNCQSFLGDIKVMGDLEKYHFSIHEGFLPRCYDWKRCYVEHGHCGTFCKLKESNGLLKKELNHITQIIYGFRSQFVHNASIPPIGGGSPIWGMYDKKTILVEMDFKKFEHVISKAILDYFDGL